MLYITSRGKLGYLYGKVFEPKADDASYDKWEGCEFHDNAVVITLNAING